MAAARITVVIPCFNDGAFVEAAVASVAEREPVEVVVVDDGSTDQETVKTLAGLERNGTHVERRPNGGLAAARMTGLAATTSRYVFALDADDQLEHGALAYLADVLDSDESPAFAFGQLVVTGTGGAQHRPPEWDPFTLLYANRWTSACLFRRDVLLDVGGWSFNDCYEDWDLLLAIAERGGRGVAVDQVVMHYRRHAGGRMNRGCHDRHAEVYRLLKQRHPQLFARRRELAQENHAPLWRQLVYPLLLGARPLYPFKLYYAVKKLESVNPLARHRRGG